MLFRSVAAAIDQEERKIIGECYSQAKTLLVEKRSVLNLVADTLLERETLKGEELDLLLEGKTLPEVKTAASAPSEEAAEASQSIEGKARKDGLPEKGRVAPVTEADR